MTTGLDNPPALQTPTELALSQTALVQRGLELADLTVARLATFDPPEQTLPVWQQLGIEMVRIPAGEFLMGSDKNKDTLTLNAELPQHTVYLPDFGIARVPVTNEQYKEFVDATGHQSISTAGIWLQNEGTVAEPRRAMPKLWEDARIPAGMEKHPVVHINWHDAQAFCRWAGVRLPTEAEWEKAARGTDGWLYPWGNEPPTAVFCNFYNGNAGGIMPVGSRPKGASPYGVLDMAGNIWEWTSSLDRPYPYQADDGREAPEAIDVRVVRGGAFHLAGYCVRCAARSRHFLSNDYWDVGFRVALSPFSS